MLEYLPDPLIPFAGSRHSQRTSFSLGRDATLLWWEVLAHTFAFERLQISSSIDICGNPALREDFVLEPSKRPLNSVVRMAESTHLSSFYVLRDGNTSWRELEHELRKAIPENWGISTLASGGVIARALGCNFAADLAALRNTASLFLTGKPAPPPRKVY
jgi:urease accessory protein